MKIGIIAESFLPRVNGVSNSVLRVGKFLIQQKHEVVIIAPGQSQVSDPQEFKIIRVPSISIPSIHDYDLAIITKKRIESILHENQIEILHVASPFVLGEISLRAARNLGIPAIAIYQTDVSGFAQHYGYGAVSKLSDYWLNHIHKLATLNLAPSRWAAEKIAQLGVENIRIWGRGVDTQSFNPIHRDLSLRLKWNPRADIFVGYVGRLAPEKFVEDLRLVPESPRIQLVVVGDGPLRHQLKKDIPDAIFTGRLQGQELATAFASLDVLLAPGRNETFCQVAQEGLAAGLCVIAPDQGATKELITQNETGFIYKNATDFEFKNAFFKILQNPDFFNRMGQSARLSVQSNTWDCVGHQLLNHYQYAMNLKYEMAS